MRPPPRVWQLVQTNVAIPKRRRSGPAIEQPTLQKSKKKYGKRGLWTERDMHLALGAVATKNMTIRQAGEFYGIPSSSI